jgi:hypothetical protein
MEIPRIEGLELNEGQAITRFTAEDLTTWIVYRIGFRLAKHWNH